MDLGPITYGEMAEAAKVRKKHRSCGPDGVPAECWQAILTAASQAGRWGSDGRLPSVVSVRALANVKIPYQLGANIVNTHAGRLGIQAVRWTTFNFFE